MFISQEHKVKVQLLKIYFGLIKHPLSCLTIFQRFSYGLHLRNQHVQDVNV